MNKEHLHPDGRPYSKEEFINKIKTDDEFAKNWGDLGKIYGSQWRSWTNYTGSEIAEGTYEMTNEPIDQIQNLINELKTNPDSRRLMVSAWNPADLDSCVLPPCHYGFQMYTRELSLNERDTIFSERTFISTKGSFAEQKGTLADYLDKEGIPRRAISLMWNQRSVDTGLGLSFNIASYALLLMMIAKQVNMIPEELVGNLGDVHLYGNHLEPIKEQLTREPYELPTVKLSDRIVNDISEHTLEDIVLENYKSHPPIKMPLSN